MKSTSPTPARKDMLSKKMEQAIQNALCWKLPIEIKQLEQMIAEQDNRLKKINKISVQEDKFKNEKEDADAHIEVIAIQRKLINARKTELLSDLKSKQSLMSDLQKKQNTPLSDLYFSALRDIDVCLMRCFYRSDSKEDQSNTIAKENADILNEALVTRASLFEVKSQDTADTKLPIGQKWKLLLDAGTLYADAIKYTISDTISVNYNRDYLNNAMKRCADIVKEEALTMQGTLRERITAISSRQPQQSPTRKTTMFETRSEAQKQFETKLEAHSQSFNVTVEFKRANELKLKGDAYTAYPDLKRAYYEAAIAHYDSCIYEAIKQYQAKNDSSLNAHRTKILESYRAQIEIYNLLSNPLLSKKCTERQEIVLSKLDSYWQANSPNSQPLSPKSGQQ